MSGLPCGAAVAGHWPLASSAMSSASPAPLGTSPQETPPSTPGPQPLVGTRPGRGLGGPVGWGGKVLEALPQTAVGSSWPLPPAPTRTRVTQTRWTSAEGQGGGLPGAECLCSSPRGGVCPMLSARPRPRGGAGNRRLRSGSPGPEGQGPACSQRPELPTAEAQPRFPGQGAQGRHEDRAPERHLSAGQDRPPSRPAGHLPEGQQHPQHLHLPRGREGGCEAGPWGWGSPARRLGRARGPRPALRGPRGRRPVLCWGPRRHRWPRVGVVPGPVRLSVLPRWRRGSGARFEARQGRAPSASLPLEESGLLPFC